MLMEAQIKSPNPSSAMLLKPEVHAYLWPGRRPGMSTSQTNPFGLYMQVAEQWQKAWTHALAPWIKHCKDSETLIPYNNRQVDYDIAIGAPLRAALPLFASGMGVLGFIRWRRKRKALAAAAVSSSWPEKAVG